MVKVFISQPMNGLTEEEILNQRNKAIGFIKNDLECIGQDCKVIDSYFEDYNPQTGSVPLKYLSKSLELLADADLVLFIGEWSKARGCRIEHQCANEYGIKTVYYGK